MPTEEPTVTTMRTRQLVENAAEERYYMASQWELTWRRFRKHKLAVISLILLGVIYFVAFTYEFWAPYDPTAQHQDLLNAPPSRIHLFDSQGSFRGPFVYGLKNSIDFETYTRIYEEDTSSIYPIRLLQTGERYKLWGVFSTNIHFLGAGDGALVLLGTDKLGRDVFSRILAGSRVSLSIGLVGVSFSFVLGCVLGGISGYYGGTIDFVIQRIVELLMSLPTTPLWMALSAAVPPTWPPTTTYFAITVILSLIGWASLARVVRGKLLELREHDYVAAARIVGASEMRIIFDHLVPGFTSYLIVHVTLAIPAMILGETALSFLGLGMRAPAVSWGTLLQDAQNVQSIAIQPWLLSPAIFVICTVLMFNFIGDGLRDAADPYK